MKETDIEIAKRVLAADGHTCVICRDGEVTFSDKNGVGPLIGWLDSGFDLKGASAADKLVGKAAALLFVLGGVKEVYSPVMSESAVKVFGDNGVKSGCDETVKFIINRKGDDICPMEKAVANTDSPVQALENIKAALEKLRN